MLALLLYCNQSFCWPSTGAFSLLPCCSVRALVFVQCWQCTVARYVAPNATERACAGGVLGGHHRERARRGRLGGAERTVLAAGMQSKPFEAAACGMLIETGDGVGVPQRLLSAPCRVPTQLHAPAVLKQRLAGRAARTGTQRTAVSSWHT